MSSHEVTAGPSDIGAEASRTDVSDPGELREELIRIAENADADDYDTMEDRVSALLSDTRRAKATQAGDGDE